MQDQPCQRRDLGPEVIDDLIEGYQRTGDRRLRNRVVDAHLYVAEHHVHRFARSTGAPAEDLHQTAVLAMVRAVDRFDASLGVSFRTFASRTVEGELKRYLRDRVWTVRPPRKVQERYLRIRRMTEELTQLLRRTPTVGEVAEELDTTVDAVLDAMEAGRARNATTLDGPVVDGDDSTSLARRLGAVDPAFSDVDERLVLLDAVSHLGRRQQRLLHLRYVEELTQPQIAVEVGLSQSYVSRLLRGSIEQIRAELVAG